MSEVDGTDKSSRGAFKDQCKEIAEATQRDCNKIIKFSQSVRSWCMQDIEHPDPLPDLECWSAQQCLEKFFNKTIESSWEDLSAPAQRANWYSNRSDVRFPE